MKVFPGDLVFLKSGNPDLSYIAICNNDPLLHLIDDENGDEFVVLNSEVADVLPISDELGEYDNLNLFIADVVEDIEETPKFVKQLKKSKNGITIKSQNIKIKITYERDTST